MEQGLGLGLHGTRDRARATWNKDYRARARATIIIMYPIELHNSMFCLMGCVSWCVLDGLCVMVFYLMGCVSLLFLQWAVSWCVLDGLCVMVCS